MNFLDLKILIKHFPFNFDIYWKPTFTNHSIHSLCDHTETHKISKFRFLIDRLLTIPLNKSNYNKEYNYIISLAQDNGFQKHTVDSLLQKRKNKLQKTQHTFLEPITPKNMDKHNLLWIDF